MAEINIQQKKKRLSPWPLIVAVLVVLALGAWFLVSRDRGPAAAPEPGAPAATPADTVSVP
ncbi:hypothetical protein EJV47_27805, partial [Hymenobacter gummosus]